MLCQTVTQATAIFLLHFFRQKSNFWSDNHAVYTNAKVVQSSVKFTQKSKHFLKGGIDLGSSCLSKLSFFSNCRFLHFLCSVMWVIFLFQSRQKPKPRVYRLTMLAASAGHGFTSDIQPLASKLIFSSSITVRRCNLVSLTCACTGAEVRFPFPAFILLQRP